MRARNLLLFTGAQLLNPVCAFLAGPLLARALGPEQRGELASIMTAALLLGVFFARGLPEAYSFSQATAGPIEVSFYGRQRRAILSTITVGMATTVAIAFAADQPLRSSLYVLTALLPAMIILEIARGGAIGRGDLRTVRTELTIVNVGRLLVIVVFFLAGNLTLPWALAATWGAALVGGLPYILAAREQRHRPSSPHTAEVAIVKIDAARERRLAWTYFATASASQLKFRADQILLLPLASAYQLGLYAVAVSISQLITVVLFALRQAFFKYASTDSSGVLTARVCRLVLPVSISAASAVALCGPPLLPLVFGTAFSAAGEPLRILAIGAVPLSIGGLIATGLGGLRMQSRAAVVEWATVIVGVVFLVLLAPAYGATGAACASTIAYLTYAAALLYIHSKASHQPLRTYLVLQSDDVAFIRRTLYRKRSS